MVFFLIPEIIYFTSLRTYGQDKTIFKKIDETNNKYENNAEKIKFINLKENNSSEDKIQKEKTIWVKPKSIQNSNFDNSNKLQKTTHLNKNKVLTIKRKGYVKANGPNISLTFKEIDPKEAILTIAKMGDYNFIFIPGDNKESSKKIQKSITISFNNEKYEKVLNSIIMASGWQAKIEGNILFVGENVLTKGFKNEFSKVYKMNNTSASSVADYLASLGAVINKVSLVDAGIENKSNFEKSSNNDLSITSYGANQGPLKGLIGTSDSRMETITLIGKLKLINLAEKYINFIDRPLNQVAMSVKILDVNLDDEDELNNDFFLKNPSAFIINDSEGYGFAIGDGVESVDNSVDYNYLNWLTGKLVSKNTRVLASPTLILSESRESLTGGQSVTASTGGFTGGSIGRPFGNESFLTVGTQVITGYSVTQGENGAGPACEATFGTAGLTFGAKLHKINSDKYITFSLSPELSSITSTTNIESCGVVNILSVRRLDTGTIRVKNGDTLVLTGVISDTDTKEIRKLPILGDLPLLGNLFKSQNKTTKQNELIILVTPKIMDPKNIIITNESIRSKFSEL